MTQLDLFPTVKSSQPDIRANLSPLPGSVKAQKMTATSGRTLCKLLHPKDPLGAFSRMLVVTSHWVSTRCYLTWKPKITPQGRLLFQLAVSMPRTDETGSGLWLTPTAMQTDEHPDKMKKRMEKYPTGTTVGSLTSQVKYAPLWPTPTGMTGGESVAPSHKDGTHGWNTAAAVNDSLSDNPTRMWPTPTTRDFKGASGKGRQERKGNPADTLPNAVAMWPTPTANEDAAGTPNGKMQKMLGNHPSIRGTTPEEWKRGSLNPTWVEWLMGYPTGHTELKD